MDRVGILVVSYGSRAAAMIDAYTRSQNYATELYVADKQRNPFNVERAKEHVVISDLSVRAICEFAKKHEDKIDFGIIGPEKPIINGIRDVFEEEIRIPLICPTKKYALEASKVAQRYLFQRVTPEANPRFRVFDPNQRGSPHEVRKELSQWLDELHNRVVVKPDRPAAGKGVGVWGDHFSTREDLLQHFFANYESGAVIVEEKIEGEESSFQALCDGKHVVPLPETRDYKRAFDGDKGPNTGGMGSYKDSGDLLPFMTPQDRQRETEIVERLFSELKGKGSNPALRGIPFYDAFIHTGRGPKILENNSRAGDPEVQNLLPVLEDDFVEICFKILDGNLRGVEFAQQATVVTYKAPPAYGGFANAFPERIDRGGVDTPVDLMRAHELTEKYGDDIRVYPGSLELRKGETFALGSRTVCVVGVGEDIQSAREISLEGVEAISGGALWHRSDIGSRKHIKQSVEHMRRLRRR
jgi:phosphoribosylamine--glycine ligase